MSQIAVRLLGAGGMNSSAGPWRLRTFITTALRDTAGTAGCKPVENNADSKSGVRDDMSLRYILEDIANVAHIGDAEKGLFIARLVTRNMP